MTDVGAAAATQRMTRLRLSLSHDRIAEGTELWIQGMSTFVEGMRRSSALMSDPKYDVGRAGQVAEQLITSRDVFSFKLTGWDTIDLVHELDLAIASLKPTAPMHSRLVLLREEFGRVMADAKVVVSSASIAT